MFYYNYIDACCFPFFPAPLKGTSEKSGIIKGEFIVIFKKEVKDNDSKLNGQAKKDDIVFKQ